jgi:hypothetical protein
MPACAARHGLGRHRRGVHRQAPPQRGGQASALRVGLVLPCRRGRAQSHSQASSDLCETLRPAQRVAALQQAQHGGGVQLRAAVHVAVLARHHVGQFAALGGHAPGDRPARAPASRCAPSWPMWRGHCRRRRALAQVVHQAGEAHRQRCRPGARDMSSTIIRCTPVSTSGWCSGGCGTPHRRSTSGSSRASAPHSRSTSNMRLGRALHQPARQLLPHALGHQRIDLAGATISRISCHRLGATRSRSGAAKRASRRMRTGSSAKASDTWRSTRASRSSRPPKGSTSVPSSAARHGVDGEVAPRQVVLERDLGRGVEQEAVVARRGLALGARQCILPRRSAGAGRPGSRGPPARSPGPAVRSGVAPTTTQSRSLRGRPSSASRTAPPTTPSAAGTSPCHQRAGGRVRRSRGSPARPARRPPRLPRPGACTRGRHRRRSRRAAARA